MKKYLLLSFLIATVLISNIAVAGTVLTILDVEKVDGNIAVWMRNEFFPKTFTDSSLRNASTYTFLLDGTKTPVDTSKTVESLGPGDARWVYLRQAWPTSGFQNLTIVYTDSTGASNYPVESALVFAKQPLTVKEVTTEPLHIYTNGSLTVRLKMLASGDKDVSNINIETLAQPKYFQPTDISNPSLMKAGEEKDFVFTYKPSGEKFPETVIYSTSYLPIKLSYSYYGYNVNDIINESFLVLNRDTTRGLIPQLAVSVDTPSEIKQGDAANIKVFGWNSIVGSNKICNLNLTLTSSNPAIEIPVSTVLPGVQLEGRADIPEEPVAEFPVKASSSAPLAKYTLTLLGKYSDCDWSVPGKLTKTLSLEVVSSAASEVEKNETPSTPQESVKSEQPSPEKKAENQKTEENFTLLLIIILAIVGIVVLFGAVYFFELRSRAVF